MNRCSVCGRDFSSVKNFDRHRVGVHEYDFDESKVDGRRCRTDEELTELGLLKDGNGRWFDPGENERAARNFGEAA